MWASFFSLPWNNAITIASPSFTQEIRRFSLFNENLFFYHVFYVCFINELVHKKSCFVIPSLIHTWKKPIFLVVANIKTHNKKCVIPHFSKKHKN